MHAQHIVLISCCTQYTMTPKLTDSHTHTKTDKHTVFRILTPPHALEPAEQDLSTEENGRKCAFQSSVPWIVHYKWWQYRMIKNQQHVYSTQYEPLQCCLSCLNINPSSSVHKRLLPNTELNFKVTENFKVRDLSLSDLEKGRIKDPALISQII